MKTAATFPSTVLIHGESGTGKELVARAIHEHSPRANGPFVTVDCTVLTETLFESLLFGHEKGAFSGAITSTQGLIRSAHGGTVFLDELGELPAPEQAKMLRLLQERTVLPVGCTRPIPVDIRIVAATHRDLSAMTEAGQFRRDLLYRLDVIRISMPPLRECAEDIPIIAQSLLQNIASTLGVRREFSSAALDALLLCHWPGNVRQMATCIERAAVLCSGEIIEPAHMELNTAGTPRSDVNLLERSSAETVRFAISASGGNLSAAARRLGIDRRQLYRMMDRLHLREQVQQTA
ncbi:MAG: sigma 54-interacting transcriptional regulator [Phycisphaeraceae bacterium]|nr:sigma 54-interacting transcriptional regulator [Phycisphaeraceae bacterium]